MCWTSHRSACTSATTRRLLETLRHLRDIGNTVLVVEHDEDAILTADYVVDVGPAAGVHGGQIVAKGTPAEIMADPASLTGRYLSGELAVPVPKKRRLISKDRRIRDVGARGNNLKKCSADIPLGTFTCITGSRAAASRPPHRYGSMRRWRGI